MPITHAFSNTVADATGTLTIWNGATTSSVAATDLVRPSNWNSAHNMQFNLAGNTTNASSVSGTDVVINGAGLVTVGGSNSSLMVSVTLPSMSDWEPNPLGNNSSFSSFGQNSLYFQGLLPKDHYTFSIVEMMVSLSSATSSISHSVAQTMSYALYSRGTGASTSQYLSMTSSSFSMGANYSSNLSGSLSAGNANTSYTTSSNGTVFGSVLSGQKSLVMPFATSITAGGDYLFAFANSTASVGGTGALRASFMVLTHATNASVGRLNNATVDVSNASNTNEAAMVIYSTTSNAWPATVARSQLSINSVNQMYLQFEA